MRIRSMVAGVAVLLAVGLPSMPAVAAGRALFRLTDSRLDEISGLAVGQRNPGLLYVQNDSGDSARFFALDRRTGAVRAECDVPAATNHDWEDLASGPSAAGVPSVWLADIGDNNGQRSQVELYRVDEPTISGRGCSVGTPQRWQLRYPDGPHDAESLILDPTSRRAYLVTKQLLGHSEVFEVPARPAPAVQTLTKVADVQFHLTGTPGGPNPIGQLTATGASMSSDGGLLVIRTYTDAYLWTVQGGDVAGALTRAPTVLVLPAQPQGEGIAIDGRNLLIDSEHVGSTVYAVPVPATLLPTPSTPKPSTPTPSTPKPSTPKPSAGPTSSTPAPVAIAFDSKPGRASAGETSMLPIGVTVAVLAGLVIAWRSRRRAQ